MIHIVHIRGYVIYSNDKGQSMLMDYTEVKCLAFYDNKVKTQKLDLGWHEESKHIPANILNAFVKFSSKFSF